MVFEEAEEKLKWLMQRSARSISVCAAGRCVEASKGVSRDRSCVRRDSVATYKRISKMFGLGDGIYYLFLFV